MNPRPKYLIRGGTLRDSRVVLEQVLDNALMGEPVLSVFGDGLRTGETKAQCIARVCRGVPIPHGKVQLARFSDVAAAGFPIIHDPSDGQSEFHYHVVFQEPVTQSQADAFLQAFSEPVPNPGKSRGA